MRLDATQVGTWLDWLWRSSWQAAVLVALVLLVQLLLKARLSARWRYNLWLIVLVRLVLPVLPESPLSIYNLVSAAPRATPRELAHQVSEDGIDAQVFAAADAEIFDEQAPTSASLAATEPHPAPASTIEGGTLAVPPPVPPAIAPPSRTPFPWRSTLAMVWLGGVLLLLARILVATAKLSRLSRRLAVIEDPSLLDLLAACKREMNVRQPITVLSSDEVPAPALMGFVRPRLLLPAPLLRDFDRRELRLILLHELAHVRRRDVAVNWIATLLHVLHWFNPVLWLALSRMRADRELATDELVLAATRAEDRHLYGQTILKLLQTLSRRTVLPGVVGILEGSHPMRRRITMIAQFKDRRPWSALAIAAIVGLSAVTLTDSVRGQATEETNETAPVTAEAESSDRDSASTATADEPRRGRRAGESAPIDPITGDSATARPPTRRGGTPAAGSDAVTRLRERRAMEAGRGGVTEARRGSTAEHADDAAAGNDHVDPAVQAQLDRRLPDIKFDAVAFVDVVDFLRDVTGANIFVNWRSLEAAGIDRNTPVSIRVRNVPFATVLRLLLDSTAPGMLRHDIDGGVIIISARSDIQGGMNDFGMGGMPMMPGAPANASPSVTRVYDVRDLLAAGSGQTTIDMASLDPADRAELSQLRAQIESAAVSHGPEHRDLAMLKAREAALLKRLGSQPTSDRARATRLQELVGIVQETIGQEQPLSVRGFNTKLIVRASSDGQREVEQLLSMLREDTGAAAAGGTESATTTPRATRR